jgi:N-acetylmuramoyl-L-alanine amidase
LGQPDDVEDYVLAIGALDPLQELSGIQARLNNLGFNCGASDGLAGPATTRALRQFQQKHNLQVSGEPDEATRDKLKQEYGS